MNRKTSVLLVTGCLCLAGELRAQEPQNHGAKATSRSHPPARPLPTAARRERVAGAKRFVDAARGNDADSGTEQAPWKTLGYALRQLKPGDTL